MGAKHDFVAQCFGYIIGLVDNSYRTDNTYLALERWLRNDLLSGVHLVIYLAKLIVRKKGFEA